MRLPEACNIYAQGTRERKQREQTQKGASEGNQVPRLHGLAFTPISVDWVNKEIGALLDPSSDRTVKEVPVYYIIEVFTKRKENCYIFRRNFIREKSKHLHLKE